MSLEAIKKQIEFYFGDSNLPKDKFLREKVSSDAGGWVDISVVSAFERMKHLLKDFETKVWNETIAKALNGSELMQVDEEMTKMRRIVQFPDDDNSEERTIYVKGVDKSATLDDCLEFFGKHGELASVRLRKYHKNHPTSGGTFKGTLFVEFKTVEDAKKFLEQHEKIKYKENDTPLTIQTLAAFKADKKKQKEDYAKKRKAEEEAEELKDFVEKYKGCMVKISGIGSDKTENGKEISNYFVIIKVKLSEISESPIVYVEHPWENDESVALARVKAPEYLKTLLERHEKEPIELGGAKVTLTPITGEEEEELLKQLGQSIKERNLKSSEMKKKFSGQKRKRGGKFSKSKRRKR